MRTHGVVPGFVRFFSTPADASAPAAAAPAADTSFADAGRAFLATLDPADHDRELTDDIGAEELTATDTTPARPTAPAPTPAADAGPIRRPDGATWNATAGRWVDAQGQFLPGEPPANAPARPAAPAAATDAIADDDAALEGDEDAPASATRVTLPGMAERGEEDLEIEVDDPAIVERLQRLRNDGMRRRQYDERIAVVNQRNAELDDVETALEADPVGFTLRQMTPERQLDVARALILEHLETLAPEINAYIQDPASHQRARVELRDRQAVSGDQLAQSRRAHAYARQVMSAVEALVPEGADTSDAEEFVAESRLYLTQLANDGKTRITPETVSQLLARRVRRYGFDRTAAPAAPAPRTGTPAPAAPAPARPVTDRAREIAGRQPTAADAGKRQQQIRTTQVRRAAATRVAPAGVGAAPVQVPVLPKEAEVSIKAASKHLREKIAGGWTPAAST